MTSAFHARSAASLLGALVLSVSGVTGAAAAPQGKFRVCADPDNLPFSSAKATPAAGLYVEVGQRLADALGRSFEPVWSLSYFGKRTVRTTLLTGKCDAYIGLPADPEFMGPRVIFSNPFLRLGYTLVSPASAPLRGIDDLSGKRVAVQFDSPPQSLLAMRDDIRMVTVMAPEEGVRALADGRADAAFVWGAVAGYLNQTELHGAYQLVPVDGPGMQWPVSVGFAAGAERLRDQVNEALGRIGPDVAALQVKYGFPTGTAVVPAQASSPPTAVGAEEPAAPEAGQQSTNPAPAASGGDAVAAGKEIFNGTCAHCHGPDAVTAERKINLRLLQHRYGDRMAEMFHTTVTHGRPDKGMPNWSGVLTEEQFNEILAYLKTVQEED